MFDAADVIYRYTRKQAIEDGVLIDVSEVAPEAGFVIPVALTAGAWAEAIVSDEEALRYGQTPAGRLWDVLWMLRCAIKASNGPTDEMHFTVIVADDETRREVQLKALCGPGDNAEPVITILLPHED